MNWPNPERPPKPPTVPCCPRCGDQTLWHISRNFLGELYGWCRLCHHTWDIPEDNPYRAKAEREHGTPDESARLPTSRSVFACDDPEGQWIKDQEEATK